MSPAITISTGVPTARNIPGYTNAIPSDDCLDPRLLMVLASPFPLDVPNHEDLDSMAKNGWAI
jgi:hypothetical protein